MKIGLIACDEVHIDFIVQHGSYPEMFATFLCHAEPGHELVMFDAVKGELPKALDACDAYIISGSRLGVNDELVWIRQLEDFVRQLHEKNKKIAGICFGHQLIAKALGGQVVKSPKGWCVGVSTNRILKKQVWMTPEKETFNLLISHQDQILELPQQAIVLASNDRCPYYMVQMGDNVLSLQGHPEFKKGYVRALMDSRKTIIGPDDYLQGVLSLKMDPDHEMIAQWLINFFQSKG